ncbi:MAG: Abi family protein [Erysipelotrichaceae bacterium]
MGEKNMGAKLLKNALTFDEQLEHLMKDKGLKVDNVKNALEVLKRENYYRLSGYWINYIDSNDKFYSYISFEKIYNNYKFDKFLRGIVIEVINDVEVYFKTRFANYHSLMYGGDGYLKSNNFKIEKQKKHEELIQKLNDIKSNNPNNLIINHHKIVYGGTMPLWAVVELLSFGNISKMFSMLTNEDKKNMTKVSYENISYVYIESFYHAIAYFRNQCCHFQRLYDVKHIIKTSNFKTPFFDPKGNNSTTFYFIYILMLLNPNHDLGERLIYILLKNFKALKIDKTKYGFPSEWNNILKKANGYCIKI